jgi:hypothetical protein
MWLTLVLLLFSGFALGMLLMILLFPSPLKPSA